MTHVPAGGSLRTAALALRHGLRVYVRAGSGARGRLAAAVIALALGVGLGFATHLVNRAALTSFSNGLRALAGGADLTVVGPRSGFANAVYSKVAAVSGVAAASPIVELDVRLLEPAPAQPADALIRVLGVDVFQAARVQPGLVGIVGAGEPRAPGAGNRSDNALLATLDPQALFLSPALAERLGAKTGDTIRVQSGSGARSLRIAGLLPGDVRRPPVAVIDIAGAHALAANEGASPVTRIEVRLAAGADPEGVAAAIARELPPGVEVELAREAGSAEANLTRSYRVNLTVLALVALFTGSMLVFSTEALAIVQRRTELALWRALGVSRRALVARLLVEAGILGVLGALLGIAFGYGLASVVLDRVGGDLGAGFFRGVRTSLPFEPVAAIGFFALGVIAALAGAVLPAIEAARAAPAQALKAGDDAALAGRFIPIPFAGGCIALGALLALGPPIGGLPILGYLAIATILVGTIAAMPRLAALVFARVPIRRVGSAAGLALAQLRSAPAQPAIGLAAIVAAVSLAVAMAIMVDSFRSSVVAWLDRMLPADVYLRSGRGSDSGFLSSGDQDRIRAVAGVARAEFLRADGLVLAPGRPRATLLARDIDPADPGARLPLVRTAAGPAPADRVPVWVSESVSERYDLAAGRTVDLPIAGTRVPGFVAGVWRDYARQQGAIVMERARYRNITGDDRANEGALWLAAGADSRAVRDAIGAIGPGIEVTTPADLRRVSLGIFDRTFAVTYGLEAVAILIGLAGIAASTSAIVLARRREFGVLRHLGLTRRAIVGLLALQGAMLAGVALAVGLAVGFVVSLVLIHVVNRQSFHWGMDLQIPWMPLALFSAALVALASLTAALSGRRAMAASVVAAVKEDW